MKHLKNSSVSQSIGEGENTLFITGNEEQATVKINNTTGEIEIEKPDYATMYLTFEAIESGTFKFSGATSDHTLSYSLDDGATWASLAYNTNTPIINAGSKIMWKGNLTPQSYEGIGNFVATGKFYVYGNVMSLLYGDDFVGQTSLTGKAYAFSYLFGNNTKVVSALNLILPATTLAEGCYGFMFQDCTTLTTAPKLPATKMANSCYSAMFDGCISLTTAPTLPATTLTSKCYWYMFRNCTSLTTAPALPATTLASFCYGLMFRSCTNLTTAPELPATTLAKGCYKGMFYCCTSLTTAPDLPATTLEVQCYYEMFRGCISLTTAPELPATTLAHSCYRSMFSSCTNLNYIKMLATDVSADEALGDWVYGVSSTGMFVKNSAATWDVTGVNGIPTGWAVQIADA